MSCSRVTDTWNILDRCSCRAHAQICIEITNSGPRLYSCQCSECAIGTDKYLHESEATTAWNRLIRTGHEKLNPARCY